MRVLIVGLLLIAGAAALSSLTALYVSWMLGNFTAVVVCVYGFVLAFRHWTPVLTAAAVYALAAGVLCGIDMRDYGRAKNGVIYRDAELRDVVARHDAAGFSFRDAQVRSDYGGAFLAPSAHEDAPDQWVYAAPIVDARWSDAQEVFAWAVCVTMTCRAEWRQPYAAALTAYQRDKDGWRAVREAEARFGLRSHPQALLLTWVSSPEAGMQAYLADWRFAVEFWAMLWIATAATAAAVQCLRRGGQPTGG